MNLRQLETFVQVAELGSFSRAAAVLAIAQPALSRQVRALEIELHETLLTRNGRGVSLTEAGQRLFEHSVAILQQVARAREDMGASRDQPVGHVTIGLPPTLARQLTVPLVEAFKAQLPRATLAIVEGLSAHMSEWITTGHVDLGLLYNPEAEPALQLEPVQEESLCLVTRAEAGALHDAVITPLPLRDLPAHGLIVPERQHVFRRLLDTQAALAGITLDVRWEVSSISAIIDLVCAGHGQAVLTASAALASGQAQRLRVQPIIEPSLVSVLCLAQPAHRRASVLMREAARLLLHLTRRTAPG